MNEENVDATVQSADSATEQIDVETLIPYHAPTLQHYGGLAELVQRNPGRGADGGAADCSHS